MVFLLYQDGGAKRNVSEAWPQGMFRRSFRAEDMSTEWIRRRLELRLVLFRERFQVGRSPWES